MWIGTSSAVFVLSLTKATRVVELDTPALMTRKFVGIDVVLTLANTANDVPRG